jgi:putative FmdB family regulatory protein
LPTYSYRCTECGTAFDIQQAFTDDSLTVCPQIINGVPCGGQLRKLFHAVGVSFSGSGFYRNDSRAPERSPDAAPAAPGAPGAPKETAPAGAPATSDSGSAKPASAKPAVAAKTPAPAKKE